MRRKVALVDVDDGIQVVRLIFTVCDILLYHFTVQVVHSKSAQSPTSSLSLETDPEGVLAAYRFCILAAFAPGVVGIEISAHDGGDIKIIVPYDKTRSGAWMSGRVRTMVGVKACCVSAREFVVRVEYRHHR